jgi:two-component system chemotaxis response regulator CheY
MARALRSTGRISALKTCLVVDDSAVARLVLRKTLTDLRFEVFEAAGGREGLELCQRSMPDAVLVDWLMPGMDGLTFARELRRLRGGRAPMVVLCTSESDPRHLRAAAFAGANDVILKPLSSDVVASKLAQVGLIEG